MSKKNKSKSTNDPSAFAKPYISQAANTLRDSYTANQPRVQEISDGLYGDLAGIRQRATNPSASVNAGMGYSADVLGGKYLGQGNPYTQGIIDQTANSITDRVQSAFGGAGRTGGGANQQILARNLAESENALRYQDYEGERGRMQQALGMLGQTEQAQYAGIPYYLQTAEAAAGLPMEAANRYAAGVGGLLGQYNTQTGYTKQGLGSSLMGLGGAALAGWAGGGFK